MPQGRLEGLCPACLLAGGAETGSATTTVDAGGRFTPPQVAELAELFPELEILDLLGAGGMGAVYKARQPALDRLVALKVLPPSEGRGATFTDRFNREARALAKLSHPNIIVVHEFGQRAGLPFFIMEYVDGANLRQLQGAGRLSPREALQIIPQICDALQYAHDQGVVHRDIKPENVMVDRQGRVKIADFGLAKILGVDADSLRLTAEGQVMGTPHYMAPEQLERPLTVDHRADIYSLGVVFYEMLTGDLPLGNFAPPSRKVQVDVRLDEVVLRALENDPERRYQKASEVRSRVETIAGTAAAAGGAGPAPAEPSRTSFHWAGFPLGIEREGKRTVCWPSVSHALAVTFGVFTVLFGLVSLTTGHSIFGWLGVISWQGVLVRLGLAGLLVGWGIWRALRKPRSTAPPRTPGGTIILPAEGYSRKAIVGACWVPFFFLASLLYFTSWTVTVGNSGYGSAPPSAKGWQMILGFTLLPLGLTAPFGATLLGWLAVVDVRRSGGRLGGLGLGLFDGLFFPLLILDVVLHLQLVEGFYWFTAQALPETFVNPPRGVVVLAGLLVCAWIDFIIIRAIWRGVRPGGGTEGADASWWWSRPTGGVIVALLCALAIAGSVPRGTAPGLFDRPPEQVAAKEPATGVLAAHLPPRGRVELLAVTDANAAPDGWWQPDGTPRTSTMFRVDNPGKLSTGNKESQIDLIFRFTDLPSESGWPEIRSDPASPAVTGTGVYQDEEPLTGAFALRMAWPASVGTATIRFGLGLAPWRTVMTHERLTRRGARVVEAGDPAWTFELHHIVDSGGGTMVTMVRDHDDTIWQTRLVAVDTDGVEHSERAAESVPGETTSTWIHRFDLPMERIREFRAQVRPLHWVEFPKIALRRAAGGPRGTRGGKAVGSSSE